jgi:hypothetical protein
MEVPISNYRLGFWSAVLASIFSIAYDIGQIAEWIGLMGSGGGPENDSTWFGHSWFLFVDQDFVSHTFTRRSLWVAIGLFGMFLHKTEQSHG